MEQDFLNKLTEITRANLSNPQFGVYELAGEMGMTRSRLIRKLQSINGKTINQFIREIRLQRAMELLQQDDLTASEISHQTGFSSPAYFSNCFHEHFGFTPGEVKKKGNNRTEENHQSESADIPITAKDPVNGEVKKPDWKGRTGRIVLAVTSGILLILAGLLVVSVFSHSKKEKSIAVMPFRNLSNDTTQQWFCDGFKEELLNNLAKIGSFSVISRISSDQYRDTKKSVKTIGKELNANYLIEGSVGHEGNNIKIWVQLIDSKKDKHLWVSDTIRKSEEEWFAIQTDLARTIAGELKALLSPEETKKIEKRPTESTEAYLFFQQANYNVIDGLNTKLAIQLYEKAIAEDPRFALAYARLARCWLSEYWLYKNRDPALLSKCKQLIDKTFELDPDLPEAHVTLGLYYYRALLRYDDALKEVEIALKQQPRNSDALAWYGYICRRSGKWDLAIKYLGKTFVQNPRSYETANELGATYQLIRNYPNAEYYFKKAVLIKPDAAYAYVGLTSMVLQHEGVTVRLRNLFENAALNVPSINQHPEFISIKFTADLYEGKYEKALNELVALKAMTFEDQYYVRPKYYYYATAYGHLKEPLLEAAYYDSARVYLEKRIEAKPDDPRLYSALGIIYAGLHRVNQAVETGKKALEYLPVNKEAISGAFFNQFLAEIYVMTGKYKEALELLDYVLSIPGILTTTMLEMDPVWAPLRALPEFRKMIRKFADQ